MAKYGNDLLANLDKVHTTELGEQRIKRNLKLEIEDAVNWCIQKTEHADNIVRKGKNWYVYAGNTVITINAYSFTIITAHKQSGAPSAIDEYISVQAEAVRPILEKIRKTIRAAAPDASEKIAWQMPTFWQGENLIHFAVFKKHIGIYPGDLSRLPFKERLAAYHCTRGAIQFPYDKPIDYELIADITRWRVSVSRK